jgi:DNA-binding transcriptional LysR family regulator
MTNEELIRNLASENLDFIFTRSSLELKELSFETLVNEEFVCAIHAHHKLAKNKSVHIKDLKDESFITLRPYLGGFYDQLMGLFTEADFKPKIVQEMPQLDAIIGVVGTGLGVGIIPATLKYLNIPNVKYLKLNGVNSTARIYLAWNKNNLNGASAKFLEIATMHKNCTDSYKE